eukprot:11213777-Lingulodinium_polyedra.AAC.1
MWAPAEQGAKQIGCTCCQQCVRSGQRPSGRFLDMRVAMASSEAVARSRFRKAVGVPPSLSFVGF